MGERFRRCEHCRAKLLRKGYYPAGFRSVFGDLEVRVRRRRPERNFEAIAGKIVEPDGTRHRQRNV